LCAQAETPLVVATVCMNAQTETVANLQIFDTFMRDAARAGAHLVVFPEIALQQNPGWGLSTYTPSAEELAYVRRTAEPVPGDSTQRLVAKARELGILVVFGMTVLGEDSRLYNASVLLGPQGVLSVHRKHRLWDAETGGNEHCAWATGTEPGTVADSPIGRLGQIICIEMEYGFAPALAAAGAQLLVTVSAWGADEGVLYDERTVENAREAQRWHVVANQVGPVGHVIDYGHSRIINPRGEIVADTGAEEGMVIAKTGLALPPHPAPEP
jgi:predicted amidohydrolase